jgi:hypothetical protein
MVLLLLPGALVLPEYEGLLCVVEDPGFAYTGRSCGVAGALVVLRTA